MGNNIVCLACSLIRSARTLDGKKYSPDERRIKLKKEGDEVFMIWTDEAKTEDSGLYQATITNCEGTVTTEANVIVNSEYSWAW